MSIMPPEFGSTSAPRPGWGMADSPTSGQPVQWGPPQDHAACGEAIAAAGREGARQTLLSLAAWFDRNERETTAEVAAHWKRADDDAAIMADGARSAWRDAAREARLRAGAGSDGDSGAVPVSPDAGEAQGHSGQLSASERDLVRADLGQLLEALGLGDYARPESPHEVMQQAIAEVGKIRSAEAERIALLLDRKRAVYCRPCDGEVCDYSDELAPASELVRGGGNA